MTMDENEKNLIQLNEKYKNLSDKIDEKYILVNNRIDKIENVQDKFAYSLSELEKAVSKFGVIVDNFSSKLDSSISNLGKTFDETYDRLSKEIDKINNKGEKQEDREKKNIDSYKGYIIGGIIGIILTYLAIGVGLK
jgi:DNA repair exonuclease SbcCD ATPase subunit